VTASSGLRAAYWLRRCTSVGARPRLNGKPFIINEGRLVLGDDVTLSSIPVQSHFVTWKSGLLEIGSGASIAQGAAIAAVQEIRIGAGSVLGPFCVISDTDFHVAGDRDAEASTSPVSIGERVHLGSRVTVLRGTVIGDGARVAAGSVVSGVVPAGASVAGVPARPQGTGIPGQGDHSVQTVVQLTLGLSQEPSLDAGPQQLPGWDSLGALRLLLALETEFGVTLREEDVARATRVAELVAAVDAARERGRD
jgi:acetyltransferase-like isoleucine patch superfamily enzyme/acyl carrier protein